MSNRNESFGRLLKGAINSIAAYEGKTAPAVEDELGGQIGEDLAGQPERNRVVWIDTVGLDEALKLSPVPLSTMGRGLEEERAYFLAAAAAGRYAAFEVPVPDEVAD